MDIRRRSSVALEGVDVDRELIIRLARESGLEILSLDGEDEVGCGDNYHIQTDLIERFAALVAAHEREECAKVCEDEGERIDASWMSCAAAIRSRT